MVLTAPISILGLIATFYMLYIFVVLSRKLGNVTKMRPYYRGLYVGMGLLAIAAISHSLQTTVRLTPDLLPAVFNSEVFYLLTYYLPMLLAAFISLWVILRYWGWLFREHDR
jgi:hypothetical protein